MPVAIYQLPGATSIRIIAQRQPTLRQVSTGEALAEAKGFVFAPFKTYKNYKSFIVASDINVTEDKLPALDFAVANSGNSELPKRFEKIKACGRRDYIDYVKSIKREISKGKFEKIVAARVVKKNKPAGFDATLFFRDLVKKYQSAFVSLVFTPQYGLWIGASPEVLLNIDRQGIKTYSLAGTKANDGKNDVSDWGAKELQEQQIVSDYIITAFKKVTKTKPVIQGPETVNAGNLLHLRTTFIYKGIDQKKWPLLINQLHPTPAVAGLPQKESIDFIHSHEKAPRAFYSGYLGPVNLNGQTNLYVNLRCMQVLKNKLAIYVGCGITGDSKPMSEWKESKMKSQTLLNVLNDSSDQNQHK